MYTEAHASFRIFADALDPSEVTRVLLLPPDHVHRKGDLRILRSKSGKVLQNPPHDMGMWSMSSKSQVNSPRLHIHLEWILGQIEPKSRELTELQTHDVRMDIFCYSYGENPDPPAIPRTVTSRIETLGISLNLDHYDSAAQEDKNEK
jgi:hypothetical protein